VIKEAIRSLSKGTLVQLVSLKLMTSPAKLQHSTAHAVSPADHHANTLKITLKTQNETILLPALQEAMAQEATLTNQVLQLQATNICNEAYCSRLHGQLAHQEAKKADPKGKGKLMGSGLPCLLSEDVFYEKVVDLEATHGQVEQEKLERLQVRGERAGLLVEWKKQQEARKAEIAWRAEWELEKQEWEAEKVAAKATKKKFGKKKPTLGKLSAAIPRPQIVTMHDENSNGDDDNNNNNNNN
jgi:hypothetical protein